MAADGNQLTDPRKTSTYSLQQHQDAETTSQPKIEDCPMTKFKTILTAAAIALSLTGVAPTGKAAPFTAEEKAYALTIITRHQQHCSKPTPEAAVSAIFSLLTHNDKPIHWKILDAAGEKIDAEVQETGADNWCSQAEFWFDQAGF
jgi:hypothetical protein